MTSSEAAYWSYHVVTVFILTVGIGWWREFLLRQEFAARSQLDEARASAEELTQRKSEFLAIMSHEVRTPLNGVLGMTELLLDGGLDGAQRRQALTIYNAGQSLLHVLNDILDFSKLEAGRVELDPVAVNLWELSEDVVSLFALQAHRKGLEIACRIASDAPAVVRVDPVRLRQVLLNLLGNAVKFTERGEVLLSVTHQAITAGGRRALCFTVSDSGIGIAADAQARLFQPFSQADGSTTRRYGGTGLGLAVSRQLAVLMGGSIALHSAPGEGSVFHLTLPLELDAERPPAPLPALLACRVLLVTGNASRRETLLPLLASLGAAGEAVPDLPAARSALALAGASPYCAVLVDSASPAPAGLALLRAEANGHRSRGVAVVWLAPVHDAAAIANARQDGADAVLCQPVRRAELAATLCALAVGDVQAPAEPTRGEAGIAPANFAGARVLVAEDNLVNQEIARGMLESLGCVSTLAADGVEALECWREQAFDLVLMDCQMLRLDGFDVTRAIRETEAVTGRHIPIIAVTANAMAEDRQQCLAAGMDDHLAKPFRSCDLAALLARWLCCAPAAERGRPPSVQAPGPRPRSPRQACVSPID